MNKLLTAFKYLLLALVLGGSIYLLYNQARPLIEPPCSEPIIYSLGTIDPRFGITKSDLEQDLAVSSGIWNAALGKKIFQEGEGGVVVNLTYTAHQAAALLGKNITVEQQAYNAKKAQVELMKKSFNKAKDAVETLQSAYNASAQKYQDEVAYWNAKGGAPAAEYQRLQTTKAALDRERTKVNTAVQTANSLADQLNGYVDELNTLGKKINEKADAYNTTAGVDFEQGQYKEEDGAKSISVYEFTETATLERVLAHEFGHALGLEHVDNPESIMYAYNIGDGLALSLEDTTELKKVCAIK